LKCWQQLEKQTQRLSAHLLTATIAPLIITLALENSQKVIAAAFLLTLVRNKTAGAPILGAKRPRIGPHAKYNKGEKQTT